MSDFIELTCPSCTGKLEITSDIDTFACAYCGTEHIIRRSGGVFSLGPVVEGLSKVRSGVVRTASELALCRPGSEVEKLEARQDDFEQEKEESASGASLAIGSAGIVMLLLAWVAENSIWSGLPLVNLGFGGFHVRKDPLRGRRFDEKRRELIGSKRVEIRGAPFQARVSRAALREVPDGICPVLKSDFNTEDLSRSTAIRGCSALSSHERVSPWGKTPARGSGDS